MSQLSAEPTSAVSSVPLPPPLLLTPLLEQWLREDIGRGDRTTQAIAGLSHSSLHQASWVAKASGCVAGLPIAAQVFSLLHSQTRLTPCIPEGQPCEPGQMIATLEGDLSALLTGERVALNLVMWLSGIATKTRQYSQAIAAFPTQLVDTRKTTPGLRLLEKYATQVGGAMNHRMGLDDAVMLKDNHIAAAGSITAAVNQVRQSVPYPLSIEVETESLAQVQEALACGVDIIMLDNMPVPLMREAIALIRSHDRSIRIEASGNITLSTICSVAETGVDYISTSAPITQATWLDISMKM